MVDVIELPPQPRKPSRAVRFADIKVGDQLMRRYTTMAMRGDRLMTFYYAVTDLWFDPVAGCHDEIAGQMVAIRQISPRTGELEGRKWAHTRRGLASNGYHYADCDFMARTRAIIDAMQAGEVVGIGFGHVIRQRPKLPSGSL